MLLERRVIRTSQSDYAYPIALVRKKSGALRLCVDYRRLNAKTRKDAYPLVRIDESLDALGGALYFLAIDLASAYNQVSDFTTPPPGKRKKRRRRKIKRLFVLLRLGDQLRTPRQNIYRALESSGRVEELEFPNSATTQAI